MIENFTASHKVPCLPNANQITVFLDDMIPYLREIWKFTHDDLANCRKLFAENHLFKKVLLCVQCEMLPYIQNLSISEPIKMKVFFIYDYVFYIFLSCND